MMSIANLDQKKRQAWQHLFNYYVFRIDKDPSSHLPNDLNDVVTELNEQQTEMIRKFLSDKLK